MGKNKLYTLILILLITPFYLNDISNIYVKDWRWWVFIDYVSVKLFPLIVVTLLIINKKMKAEELGLKLQPIMPFITVFLMVTFIGTLIDQNAYKLIAQFPGYHSLGNMPIIKSSAWNWADLTVGLLMVGIFEELVFRGFMCAYLNRYTKNRFAIVLISSLAFGLIHWSGGLHVVLVTSVIGAVFMIAYLKTRSLPAIMLA
ncbi:MAG: CPBP family intramembrane glutamic endopeptidase, partial [Candidatus Margulisiibacteriota bacterium]